MEWINVKDRLPDCWSQHGNVYSSGYVLVYTKYKEQEIDSYFRQGEHTGKGFVCKTEGWNSNSISDITHWMPLPAPPTKTPPPEKETDNVLLAKAHAAEVHNG